MAESSGPSQASHLPETTKLHKFIVSDKWTHLKLGFRMAAAVTIALAISQNSKVSGVFSTTSYVVGIFVILFQINANTRAAMFERVLLAGVFAGLMTVFGMLGFLCSHATRDATVTQQQLLAYVRGLQRGDVPGPAIFYQAKPAAVAAVFLFLVAWIANVLKTLFVPQTFSVVAGTILCGILFLEGYLFPNWSQFYSLVKQLLYAIYAALAISLAANLVVFPYNAREQYLSQVDQFLSVAEQMTAQQAHHFSTSHHRHRNAEKHDGSESSNSQGSSAAQPKKKGLLGLLGKREKPEPTQLQKLQELRTSLTALSSGLGQSKVAAKREIAFGHLKASDLELLAKRCQSLITPLFGLNIWSQITDLFKNADKSDDEELKRAFLEAIGLANRSEDDVDELFQYMEDKVLPRFNRLSSACSAAVLHIKKGLHLGVWKRPPFWLRPFIKCPAPYSSIDESFASEFQTEIDQFWKTKSSSVQDLLRGNKSSKKLLAIVYMESALYDVAQKLLDFCKWVDDLHTSGVMSNRHFIRPSAKRYTKAIRKTFAGVSHQANPPKDSLSRVKSGLLGAEDSSRIKEPTDTASNLFLKGAKPTLDPRTSRLAQVGMFFYRILKFLESPTSRFAVRAALAMLVTALPVYFPGSARVFLEYRLLWITFTVLLGLQPVLGRGVFSSVLRMLATIVGGVLGLLCVEIGRVPAGILVVFFVTLLPQYLGLLKSPMLMLIPVLLSTITEVLVVGYYLTTVQLPRSALLQSGQLILGAPAIMGYRILLTLAGVVVALLFSVFPALPTGRSILRDVTSQRFFTIADIYMLISLRGASERYVLPPGLDKAIMDLQRDSIGLSANAHQLIAMTPFEPSPRGTFPQAKWKELLVLMDNLGTCLAVSNARFSDVLAAAPELEVSKLLLHSDADKYFRTVTATLFSLGNSYNLWQPLPPVLPSPMKAHLDTQKGLYEFRHILAHEAAMSEDAVAQFGAYLVTNAIMTHLLERILQTTGELIGVSGYKSYLRTHMRHEQKND